VSSHANSINRSLVTHALENTSTITPTIGGGGYLIPTPTLVGAPDAFPEAFPVSFNKYFKKKFGNFLEILKINEFDLLNCRKTCQLLWEIFNNNSL
jgi:hypothetical protein